jgi:ribosomal-protein-alanine acetyltransferase
LTWQFRRATSADLDAVMAIETAVFGTDAWSRATVHGELASVHGYYLVAFPPDNPATIEAYAGLHAPMGEPQADIQTIAVAATARRHGVGRALMRQLIAEARERGAREVFLEVRADNPNAKALYDELGFEAIAVRPRYYQPDDVDAVVMRLTIPEPTTEPT